MAELIELPSVATDSDAIAVLESVIEKVRAGQISSVAIACVYRDGTTGDAWSQSPALGTLIGAVSILHARLIARITKKDGQ